MNLKTNENGIMWKRKGIASNSDSKKVTHFKQTKWMLAKQKKRTCI